MTASICLTCGYVADVDAHHCGSDTFASLGVTHALSVLNPFAWLLVEGIKPVENRVRNFARRYVGKTIALHASATVDREWQRSLYAGHAIEQLSWDQYERGLKEIPATFGHIVGVARVARVISLGDLDAMNFNPWRIKTEFGLVFEAPRKLQRPWFAKGWLGIWSLADQLDQLAQPAVRR